MMQTTRSTGPGYAGQRFVYPALRSVVAGLAAAVMLLAAPTLAPVEWGAVAYAKDDDDKKLSGRKTQALGKKVYEAITAANELVDTEDYNGARAILDKIDKSKLTSYETAQVNNFYGFLYYNAENYPRAIKAYETVLAQPDIPEALVQGTIRTLSQLYFVQENFDKSIQLAERYNREFGEDPELLALIGTAYYQKNQPAKIVAPIERAIAIARERGTTVKEQWWLLLRVAYWEQDNYKKVKEILEILVVNWPKKEYWTQLSGIYYELKDEPRQLAAYEAAYDQGLLSSNGELVQMAQLFLQAEIPYKAAKVLEQGFESEQVERTVRNLRLLSQSYQLAREDSKAIAPLKEAAGLSGDGELYARLANSYLNLSQYGDCISSAKKAISKGGLKKTGNAYLTKGMCEFDSKKLASAKNSFANAAKYSDTKKYARQWMQFVENEQSRLAKLNKSLKKVRNAQQAAEAS